MAPLLILPFLYLFLKFTTAMPWLEPSATPTDVVANTGMSLRPTEAPGLNGMPKELLRRQASPLPSTPPSNWCGFINGDPNSVLSCDATKTCVYSGYAVGCCDAGVIATCTNLFTTCVGYSDNCDGNCMANANVLKCSYTDDPYCGSYAFPGGTANYNCGPTTGFISSVEFVGDYYYSNLGITLGATAGPITVTVNSESLTSGGAAATSASGTAISNVPLQLSSSSGTGPPQSSSSSNTDPSTTTTNAIGVGAIAGIAVGAAIVILAIIAALIAWCCIRRRRRRRTAAMQRPAHLPPVPSATAAAAATPQPPQPQMTQQQPPQPDYGSQQQYQQDPKYPPANPLVEPAYLAPDSNPTNDPYALPSKPSGYNPDATTAPAAAAFHNDKHNHDPYQNLPATATAASPPQYSPPTSLPPPNPNTHEISGQPLTDYSKHPNPSVSEIDSYTPASAHGSAPIELAATISPLHTGLSQGAGYGYSNAHANANETPPVAYASVPMSVGAGPGRLGSPHPAPAAYRGSEAEISELGTPVAERRARSPLPGGGGARHGSEGGVSELGSPVTGFPGVGTVSPLQTGGMGAVERSAGLFGGEYPPGVFEVEGGAGGVGRREGVGGAVGQGGGQGGGARLGRNIYEMS